VIGVIATFAFVWAESRAAEPILPLTLFHNRIFTMTSAIGFIVGFGLFGAVTFLPLYLQVVQGVSPTASGLQLLPMMGGMLVSSIGSGFLISRTGRYKLFPIIGTSLMTIAMVLFSLLAIDTPIPVVMLEMVVLGAGLGLVMQVLILAAQNAVEPKDIGVATAGSTLFRQIGGSIGLALFGALFANRLGSGMAGMGADAPVSAGGLNTEFLAQLPPDMLTPVLEVFVDALHVVFLAAAIVAAFAFALSWFVREVPLRDHTGKSDDAVPAAAHL
jgi:predicted MFS family arabinose efflux permease